VSMMRQPVKLALQSSVQVGQALQKIIQRIQTVNPRYYGLSLSFQGGCSK